MTVHRTRVTACTVMLLAGTLACVSAADAAISAHISQNPVYAGDTFTLTLSADGGSGGQPDLTPLRNDFDIVGTGTSSQMSMINGRTSSMTQWRIELHARHSGDLKIPTLQVGGEHSQPIDVKVTDSPPANDAKAAAAGQHVIVDAGVDPGVDAPYVQQQIPYRVRLYMDDAVRDGALTEPQMDDTVIEPIGDEARYTETRNGRPYRVIERRYAIFAQKSGELEIPPVRFEGTVADGGNARGRRSHADGLMQRFMQGSPFANDPFFSGGLFGDPGRPVRSFGPAVKVNVRPRAGAQSTWLPATAVRVHDSWTTAPPSLEVGEPVTRTITIEADGLTGAQIPVIDTPAPGGLRQYREPAENATHNDGKRLVGVSRQTVTYIPDAAGTVTLPAMRVDWWDTTRDVAATATLPAWDLKIAPGSGAAAVPSPAASEAATARTAEDAPAASSAQATHGSALQASRGDAVPMWRALLKDDRTLSAAALVLLFAVGLAVWWWVLRRSKTPFAPEQAATTSRVPARPATQVTANAAPRVLRPAATDVEAPLRMLETACRDRDAQAAARALLALAAAHWPQQAPHNLGDLADRLGPGGDAVRSLDRHLYAAGDAPWPADELWQAMRSGLSDAGTGAPAPDAETLPPLYPRHA